MDILIHPSQWLFHATFWFMGGLLLLGVLGYGLEMLDHAIYVGVPAIFTSLILDFTSEDSILFEHQIWVILLYGVIVTFFYAVCYHHVNYHRNKTWDPNEDEDDENKKA